MLQGIPLSPIDVVRGCDFVQHSFRCRQSRVSVITLLGASEPKAQMVAPWGTDGAIATGVTLPDGGSTPGLV